MSDATIAKHPFRWHATKITNSPDSGYVCFSRLRGWDKIHYPTEEQAIAARDDLNNIEKWNEWYPLEEVEKLVQAGVPYSEHTLKHLSVVGEEND